MNGKRYEDLLRYAFGLQKGKRIPRHGDPARLAAACEFTEENFAAVKAAAAYAMEIVNCEIFNDFTLDISDEELNHTKEFTRNVLATPDLGSLSNLIEDFYSSVIDKYQPRRQQTGTS
ncbi:MAG: hypothetical protein ACOYCD_05905 [Kiritimatiellia bacterium]|jgi:hypothetical protein